MRKEAGKGQVWTWYGAGPPQALKINRLRVKKLYEFITSV
jgi:hypothetical protein